MANYITTESDLTQVANAIRAKGNTSAQLEYPDDFVTAIQNIPAPGVISQLTVTQNGTYTAAETAGYNPVIVNVQPLDIEEKDVNFIDYDGTILYSYTADEFAELTALPANPSHSGLIAEGWNWTLSDAQTYVATYKRLVIGQLYNTSDSKCRIYVKLEEDCLSPQITLTGSGSVTVNWGDRSAPETLEPQGFSTYVTFSHNYSEKGEYIITLEGVSGTFDGSTGSSDGTTIFWGGVVSPAVNNAKYWGAITKVEMGQLNLDYASFRKCYNLQSITTAAGKINNLNFSIYAFKECSSLQAIIITNTTYSQTATLPSNHLYQCHNLKYISLSKAVDELGDYCLQECESLKQLTIPDTVTTIGTYACYKLCNVKFLIIPQSVTTIQNYAFGNNFFSEILFTPTTPPTISGSSAFTNLPTDCKIYVPVDSYNSYRTGTNYPSSSTYTYIGFKTYANGTSLPSQMYFDIQGMSYPFNVTWYATKKDAINQTNAITTGNGKEIYARLEFAAP